MKRAGVIGLGAMGLGLARNLHRAGFPVTGFDLRAERREMLEAFGGVAAATAQEVGTASDLVFIMVLNGAQTMEVLQGPEGVLAGLAAGSTVAVSATVKPVEVQAAAHLCQAAQVHILDSPVSGGQSGAEAGTLSMMVAGPPAVLEENRDFFAAVGDRIMHVGDRIGQGQTAKAALQALIGTTFAGVFEALVLGSKAGIEGHILEEVIGASHVSSALIQDCIRKVRARAFVDTGNNIATIHKDLTITMDLARREGVCMFATAAAMEIMQAGISTFPGEDNWAVVKWLERIAGTEVH